MVGAAIIRQLKSQGFENILTASHQVLDLMRQDAVLDFFSTQNKKQKIDYVVLAAAKVGGIHANNTYPAQFIYENLMIACNVIHSAYQTGVKRLLFLGSSCIYPKLANQPMQESELLTGVLESTNEPYAIAKIAGIKLCESYNRQYGTQYRSVMPTNLYGEDDNFHLENSHVVPALMRRCHEAKIVNAEFVEVWGSGNVMREFLHVEDMAAASVHVMGLTDDLYQENTEPMLSHINVGTGEDVTIRALSELIAKVVGFQGEIRFDASKPEGTPRKLLDVSRLEALGWKSTVSLETGLTKTYSWFLENKA
jgi:GDP-L-fucose synthase